MTEKIESLADENNSNKKYPDKWKIRRCETYEEEYKDCRSIKARFNQYFIFGKSLDCSQWKVDFDNCERWCENDDIKAYNELISSENKRREERLRPHLENDTWKKRISPPLDWNKPLPAWLEEENKVSYLALKADEMRETGRVKEGERSLCVIS